MPRVFPLCQAILLLLTIQTAFADATYQSLPFSQNWTDLGLITTNDIWTGVPGILGYRGDELTAATDVDAQTVTAFSGTTAVLDVNANQTAPNTFSTGGATEFHLTDPVVALTGSGTADAPFLLIHLNTTGKQNIQVSYRVRDLENGADNAGQQLALQYRIGDTGPFINVPAGYIADATAGPNTFGPDIPISVTLPAVCNNVAQLQIRMITTNAGGNDEWVGIDDISVTGTDLGGSTNPSGTGASSPSSAAQGATSLLTVTVVPGTNPASTGLAVAADLTAIGGSATQSLFDNGTNGDVSSGDNIFSFLATIPLVTSTGVKSLPATITDAQTRTGAANIPVTVTAATPGITCGATATLISAIQGTGLTSPIVGQAVEIEGVVVGDYQGAAGLRGFFVQEEVADQDALPTTSEGIFVFDDTFGVNVNAGDVVRVRGTVTEFNSSGATLTELSQITNVVSCSSGASVPATPVTLPVLTLDTWERYEGMLISLPAGLVVIDNFVLGRFGSVELAPSRLQNPTEVAAPSTTPGVAAQAVRELNLRSRIILDDGSNTENPDPVLFPGPAGLSGANTLRVGYTVSGPNNGPIQGVIEQRFGLYRVHQVSSVPLTFSGQRPAFPPAPSNAPVTVSSFNLLNYFSTIDNGPDICGPAANQDCRGADADGTPPPNDEYTRQLNKLVAAMTGINADIFGVIEIENNTTASAQTLVNALNAATTPGTWTFINTGTIGTDAIKIGLLYKPARVSPVGPFRILDSSVDPLARTDRNRPVLAQLFEKAGTRSDLQRFTVLVNHWKSKGSACTPDDPDIGDLQGECNQTRKGMAQAVVNWLATNPTNDPAAAAERQFLLMGDLNSYSQEDPVKILTTAGYRHLNAIFEANGHSYVFQGESGNLDHAVASSRLERQVINVATLHLNADEPVSLDYNREFKSAGQLTSFYAPGPFRASDHDPVIVGLNPLCGDLNDDGVVNTLDQNLLRAALGKAASAVERRNDFDGDGQITYNDYRVWAACYVRFTTNPR